MLQIEIDDIEIIIEDEDEVESWVKAFGSKIEDIAEAESVERFYNHGKRDELDKEISDSIATAMRMRLGGNKPEGETWSNIIEDCLLEFMGDSYTSGHSDEVYGIVNNSHEMKSLVREIEFALEDTDILWMLDDIRTALTLAVTDSIVANDTSTPLDEMGNCLVPLAILQNPSEGYKNLSIDDFCIYRIREGGGAGAESLVRLLGVSIEQASKIFGVEPHDHDAMSGLIGLYSGLSIEGTGCIVSEADFDELCSSLNGSVPCWYGEVTLNDLVKSDPLNSIKVKGGVVGVHDFCDGAGSLIKLSEDHELKFESGCLVVSGMRYMPRDVYGYSTSIYKADICATREDTATELKVDKKLGKESIELI